MSNKYHNKYINKSNVKTNKSIVKYKLFKTEEYCDYIEKLVSGDIKCEFKSKYDMASYFTIEYKVGEEYFAIQVAINDLNCKFKAQKLTKDGTLTKPKFSFNITDGDDPLINRFNAAILRHNEIILEVLNREWANSIKPFRSFVQTTIKSEDDSGKELVEEIGTKLGWINLKTNPNEGGDKLTGKDEYPGTIAFMYNNGKVTKPETIVKPKFSTINTKCPSRALLSGTICFDNVAVLKAEIAVTMTLSHFKTIILIPLLANNHDEDLNDRLLEKMKTMQNIVNIPCVAPIATFENENTEKTLAESDLEGDEDTKDINW